MRAMRFIALAPCLARAVPLAALDALTLNATLTSLALAVRNDSIRCIFTATAFVVLMLTMPLAGRYSRSTRSS